MFGDALQSVEQVDCTLDRGTTTTCMQLTFTSNAVGDTEGNGTVGPYCSDSITTPRDEAEFGVYDGPTTPGFQPLVDAAFAMDADGYDIVSDDGTISVGNLISEEPGLSYCLQAAFDSTLELTCLIPIEPELRSEPWDVGTVDSVGVSVSGVPFKSYTPSVTVAEAGVGGTGSGNIPSLDHCGGHPDPAGYYHPVAVDPTLFVEGPLIGDVSTEECTLNGGTQTSCYRLTIAGAPMDESMEGPYCAPSITSSADEGGTWFDGSGPVYNVDGDFIVNLPSLYNDDRWQMYAPIRGWSP